MNVLEITWFAVSALLIMAGALVTVVARKPVRCAMGLLTTILGVASCYLLLSAELLAAIQLIVYAGGVVVLFLFVVMLLGPGTVSPSDGRATIARMAGALLFVVVAAAGLVLVSAAAGSWNAPLPPLPDGYGTIQAVGHEIFTLKIIPFELTGLLLLVAVVGAMAVARGKHPDPTRAAATTALVHSQPSDQTEELS